MRVPLYHVEEGMSLLSSPCSLSSAIQNVCLSRRIFRIPTKITDPRRIALCFKTLDLASLQRIRTLWICVSTYDKHATKQLNHGSGCGGLEWLFLGAPG